MKTWHLYWTKEIFSKWGSYDITLVFQVIQTSQDTRVCDNTVVGGFTNFIHDMQVMTSIILNCNKSVEIRLTQYTASTDTLCFKFRELGGRGHF